MCADFLHVPGVRSKTSLAAFIRIAHLGFPFESVAVRAPS